MGPSTAALRVLAGLLGLCWLALGGWLLFGSAGVAGVLPPSLGALLVGALCLLAALREPQHAVRLDSGLRLLLGLCALVLSLALLPLPLGGAGSHVALPANPTAPDGAYAQLLAAVLSVFFAGALLVRARAALGLAALSGGLVLLLGTVALAGASGTAAGLDVPSACLVPSPTQAAVVEIRARGRMDGRTLAWATLSGRRVGGDEAWQAQVGGPALRGWSAEFVQRDNRAWLSLDGGAWGPTGVLAGPPGGAATLDIRLLAALAGQPPAAYENLGLATVDGVPARHCRVAVDGGTATEAVLPMSGLIGGPPLGSGGERLEVWRGQLDWWIGPGGRLLRAQVLVGGHPDDAWALAGLRGRLRATISIAQPAAPPPIEEPLP